MAKKTTTPSASTASSTTTKKTTEKTDAAPKTAAKKVDLSNFLEEIKAKAYDIFEERDRNGQPGNEMSDWLAAEAEIKRKYNIK